MQPAVPFFYFLGKRADSWPPRGFGRFFQKHPSFSAQPGMKILSGKEKESRKQAPASETEEKSAFARNLQR